MRNGSARIPQTMNEVMTYRLSSTGIWNYQFYDRRRMIGSAGTVFSPSSPVRIEGGGINWYSRFDIDQMIAPGVSRRVMDNQTGLEVYRLIFWQPGKYELRAAEASVQAEIRNGVYLFGKPLKPVCAMTERISEADWIPPNRMTVEPWFRTRIYEDMNDVLMMAVLSFPALMFY